MGLLGHCRRLCVLLILAMLAFAMNVSQVFAQAGVPEREETGKSYALGYMGVIVVLAVALILVCKSSGREKELKFQKEEDV